MTTSPSGRRFISSFEGLRLKAYQDSVGVWTIGTGHTKDVKPGDTCTKDQADAWLAEDLSTAEAAINNDIRVPLNQNQFDALVSFTFNVGVNAMFKSTLRSLLNQGAYQGAANQFLAWDKAGGKIVDGLTKRRNAERALFMTLPSGDAA